MELEDNKRLIREHYEELVNRNNWAAADSSHIVRDTGK
jgi:hypothetical protein